MYWCKCIFFTWIAILYWHVSSSCVKFFLFAFFFLLFHNHIISVAPSWKLTPARVQSLIVVRLLPQGRPSPSLRPKTLALAIFCMFASLTTLLWHMVSQSLPSQLTIVLALWASFLSSMTQPYCTREIFAQHAIFTPSLRTSSLMLYRWLRPYLATPNELTRRCSRSSQTPHACQSTMRNLKLCFTDS